MDGAIGYFLLFPAGDPAGNAYILQGGEFRKEVVELEYETDMFIAEGRNFPVVQKIDLYPVDLYLALIGRIEGAEDMKEGTFPGTGRTNDTGDFALPDIDIHSFQHP